MYRENGYKWVVVAGRDVSPASLMNAVAHLSLSMASCCSGQEAKQFHEYIDGNGKMVSSISNWPVIVLGAKNCNQLRMLRVRASEAGVPCQAFVGEMIGGSADEQLAKTSETMGEELTYWAVMLFGHRNCVDPLIKRFSLFR